jgi:hypothetical protein
VAAKQYGQKVKVVITEYNLALLAHVMHAAQNLK